MYDLEDDDFAGSYDKEKCTKKGKPFFPFADFSGRALLQYVEPGEGDKMGKYFEYGLKITKSNTDSVVEGALYILRYKRGASKVEKQQCWKNMSGILEATCPGEEGPAALGKLLHLSKTTKANEAGGEPLALPLAWTRKMEPARKDKETGKYKQKDLEDDGVTPKKYSRDTFTSAE